MDDLTVTNRRNIRARIHIDSHTKFIQDIVLDRDADEYPDPFIRNLTKDSDASLLSSYLTRSKQAIKSYNPETEAEKKQCQEFLSRERTRLNAQIGQICMPQPEEKNLRHITSQIDKNALKTGYAHVERNISWELYRNLHQRSLEDLRYLAAYYTVDEKPNYGETHPETVRIINAIRYVRGDPTVSLENFIYFKPIEKVKEDITVSVNGETVELTEGVPFSEIKQELRRINSKFDSLITALAFASIQTVMNYSNPKVLDGSYNPQWINISKKLDEDGVQNRNIVVHEFFHAVQDIIGARDMSAVNSCVEFSETPSDWEMVRFQQPESHLNPIHEKMKECWFKFRTGKESPLCEYQTKNIHEMYAVAFESFFESQKRLKQYQPMVHNILKELMTIGEEI